VGAHARQIVVMLLLQFAKPVLVANVIAWLFAYYAAQKYLSVFSRGSRSRPCRSRQAWPRTVVVRVSSWWARRCGPRA